MYSFSLCEEFRGVVFGKEKMVKRCSDSVYSSALNRRVVRGIYSIRNHSANFLYSIVKSSIFSFSLISLKRFVKPSIWSVSLGTVDRSNE